MMVIYKTKRDINGNTYCTIIDHDKKTYKNDYNIMFYPQNAHIITVGKRERQAAIYMLEKDGYKQTY